MVVSKTKHSKTKTEARSTQISKTKTPRSKTKHPKTRKQSTLDRKRSTQKLENEDPLKLENEAPKTRKRRPLRMDSYWLNIMSRRHLSGCWKENLKFKNLFKRVTETLIRIWFMQDKQSFYKVLSPFWKLTTITLICSVKVISLFFLFDYIKRFTCACQHAIIFFLGGDFELKNLEGVPGSRRHSTTSLNDNIEAAKKRYQMLEVW